MVNNQIAEDVSPQPFPKMLLISHLQEVNDIFVVALDKLVEFVPVFVEEFFYVQYVLEDELGEFVL